MTEESQSASERDARWRGLMQAAQAGDRVAYERLLVELLPFVRGVVRRRVRSGEEDDVVQEVLLSIHSARHTYRPGRPLAPWVRAIARNASIDWLRREIRVRQRTSDADSAEIPAAEPAGDVEARPLPPSLQRALEKLPGPQREAVLLLKVQGLSVAEAARQLGVSPGALKLRAHRGYRALRTSLGARGRGAGMP
jgi:RNA polymerase sigma-70 factor (ECF subfamily)